MSLLSSLLDRTIFLSYDRSGFLRHAAGFSPEDLRVDLGGRVCLVTGASSGLGVEITRGLFERGATVLMACRNTTKGEAVRARIEAGGGRGRLEVGPVDLGDLGSVRAFAATLRGRRLDVLVHNAGVLLDERRVTPDGIEQTAATNLVGPFLLTHLLWQQLSASDDPRLVHVSSGGMYSERLDVRTLLDPPSPFDGVAAYARTKRAQVVLGELLALRAPHIRSSSMHPGWADTPGVEGSLPRFHRLTRAILRTPAQGADTAVWLAASDRAKDPRGRFYFDRAPQPTHLLGKTRETEADRDAFWQALCRLIGADPGRDFR